MTPQTPRYRPHVANIMCMLSMLIWAVALPGADLLIGTVPALQLTAARMALAAACLIPAWYWWEGRHAMQSAGWWRGAWIGGTTIGLGAFLLVIGQGMTDSVTVAVISAAMPIMGIAIEVVLDGRKLTVNLVVGVLLSLAGGLLVLGDVKGGGGIGVGALLCFSAVLLFTIGSRLTVSSFPRLTALGQTTITLAGAALLTCLAAGVGLLMGNPSPGWTTLGWREWGALVLYAVGGLALSQMLWIASVGSIGIGVAALHINATPFYVMITLFLLGGPWSWTQALAATVVGLGVLVAQDIIPLAWRRKTSHSP